MDEQYLYRLAGAAIEQDPGTGHSHCRDATDLRRASHLGLLRATRAKSEAAGLDRARPGDL